MLSDFVIETAPISFVLGQDNLSIPHSIACKQSVLQLDKAVLAFTQHEYNEYLVDGHDNYQVDDNGSKKCKAAELNPDVPEWLPEAKPPTRCGKGIDCMYLHFDLEAMTQEQRALYVIPLQQLIEKNDFDKEYHTCHDMNCPDKLPLIHRSVLTKVVEFLL